MHSYWIKSELNRRPSCDSPKFQMNHEQDNEEHHTTKDLWAKAVKSIIAGIPSKVNVKLDLQNLENTLFDYFCEENDDKISITKFKNALFSSGLRDDDPRLKETIKHFNECQLKISYDGLQFPFINREKFKECIQYNIVIIAKAFRNDFIIPEFYHFTKRIEQLYWKAKSNTSGEPASYIPQLARYNPDLWGVSICTVDGQRYSIGDTKVPFCIQSVSKSLTYALALKDLGPSVVHQYVGQEPSGVAFNSISLNPDNKPHNPMINPGAIVTCSLIKQDLNSADRFDYATNMYKRMVGHEYLGFNNSVFLSERDTADRNFALGYYLRENKCFPKGTNLMEVMDFYFQLCSTELNAESMSVAAATFANGGICPTTGDNILNSDAVRNTLSLMHSCGMYDYSGQFAFKVGLPAKSGVAGSVMIVVPNVMGICCWSPPLDQYGNSCRGIQFAEDLVSVFNFHNYDNLQHQTEKEDPRVKQVEIQSMVVVNLLYSAYNGDVTALRRYALSGMDMSEADYDGRTALHVASAEGHEVSVKFLLDKCKANPFSVDRWGFTPLDDAKRFSQTKCIALLEEHMSTANPDWKKCNQENGQPVYANNYE